MPVVLFILLICIWEVRGMVRNRTRGIAVFVGLAVISLILCYFSFFSPKSESLGGIIMKIINAVFYRGDKNAGQ